MNRTEVWKNFDLGTEIDIAGTFVYNGLRALHEMRTLDEPEEIFEFFYNLAVGIERLMKVALILLEHSDSSDQQEFEKSLRTHTHLELLRRVKAQVHINIEAPHNEFLGMLGTFYNSFRYDRFTLSPTWNPDKEKSAMRSFLQKNLSIALTDDSSFFPNENTPQIRKYLGNLVRKISAQIYGIITERARSSNLYTYELRSDSKAAKIFVRQAVTFADEDVLWKELLIFLLNTKDQSELLDYLRSFEPLAFDAALIQDYLQAFRSEVGKQNVVDELEALYENLDAPVARLQALQPIGDPNVLFDSGDEEWEEGDDVDGSGFV